MNVRNISFGVMKNIKNMSMLEIKNKIIEEHEELQNEIRLPEDLQIKENILAEAFDLMQVTYTLIRKVLEKTEYIDLEILEANMKHIEKLKKRGYIE